MDLQFINVSDPQQIKSGQARHLVRSQAMRSYRHRQREHVTSRRASKKPHAKLNSAKDFYASPSTSPRDLSEEEAEGDVLVLQAHFSAIIKATKENISSIPPHPLSQAFVFKVLDYYAPTIGWAFVPIDKSTAANPLAENILPLAIRDAALFHAILADSGNDMLTRHGDVFDLEHGSIVQGSKYGSIFCMRHKLEGIRIINEKLSDPTQSVSDESIIAICHLIGLESLSDSKTREEQYREVKMHMDGIKTIVEMRGGLKSIGQNHFLTQMVLWVDQLYASLAHQSPRFPALTLFSPAVHFPAPPTPPRRPHGLPPGTLSRGLETILSQLSAATQFLQDLDLASHVSEADFYSFGIKRALVSDALLALRPRAGIEACARDAGVLYVLTCLTNMNCEVCRDLIGELRRSMEGLDLDVWNAEAPGLVLWIMLIGGGGAPRNKDRDWFVEMLGRCLRTAEWDEVQERLEGWAWRPRYCGPWREVWRDAVALKRVFEVDERILERLENL